MWSFHVADSFHSYNVFAVYADEGCEACVYGSVVYLLRCGVELRYNLANCQSPLLSFVPHSPISPIANEQSSPT
jgi:hypothetical protein